MSPRSRPTKPLTDPEFAELMAQLGLFEPAPRVAVGVSGGADSLALIHFVHAWSRDRGGQATALIVDHGLRPESAGEAARLRQALAASGIEQRILRWRGPKPRSNVHAAARRARYDLMGHWCTGAGVLHLALAHHLDDQAETLLLRLGRGSGLDGLAAMAAIREMPGFRLLRPLLGVPKSRLAATLTVRRRSWIEDPSNTDPSFARVRLRGLLPALDSEGLTVARLAAAAAHLGRARAALERSVARLLARAVELHPAGFAWVDPGPLFAAPDEVALRALARVLMIVGGQAYTPRFARLRRLRDRISVGLESGLTLAGCRIMPRRGRLLFAREPARIAEQPLQPGRGMIWDGRFEVNLGRSASPRRGALSMAPLGAAGWRSLRTAAPTLGAPPIPAPARAALPALRDALGIVAVPHLGYQIAGAARLNSRNCRLTLGNGQAPTIFTVA